MRQYRILYTEKGKWGGPPGEDGNMTLAPFLWWQDDDPATEPDLVDAETLADTLSECRKWPSTVDAWLEFREVTEWGPVDRDVRSA